MAKTSTRKIYQQSNHLKDQIPLLPFMKSKDRSFFVREVRALIDTARQAEESTESQQTKSRLQNLIETWEELLMDIKHLPVRKLPVISTVAKTSPALTKFQMEDALHRFPSHRSRLASQVFSSGKVDPNSPVTIPLDPELRDIFDELSGIVDATGHTR